MRSKAMKRAQSNYRRTLRDFRFSTRKDEDADLIRFLEGKENVQSYLKGLVRADMKKSGS